MSIEAKTEFEAMDKLDEDQIVAELKGKIIDKYFYEFGSVVGISWAGIKHIANKMADQGQAISIEEVNVQNLNDRYSILAMAINLKTKAKRWGAAECPKMMKLKDGEKEDPFAYQKALSKAQRNALRNHIPEIAIQEGYKEWKKKGSIEQVFGDRITGDKK